MKDKSSLNELLDSVTVFDPGMWENDDGPKDWYAVSNDDGIIAYFGDENDAYSFRLDYINRILNPYRGSENSLDNPPAS